MPKLKKTIKTAENQIPRPAWRTPVKLPGTNAVALESLYSSTATEKVSEKAESQTSDLLETNLIQKKELSGTLQNNQEQQVSLEAQSKPFSSKSDSRKPRVKPQAAEAENVSEINSENHSKSVLNKRDNRVIKKISEVDFLKLLKTERMDFYSLAEILRGSSLALYSVLYAESRAKGENRCQIRQSELMMRAGINNPATLYKQERWLTALGLIKKNVRLGNHSGASYEIELIESLPLPTFILNQFEGYLAEYIK